MVNPQKRYIINSTNDKNEIHLVGHKNVEFQILPSELPVPFRI